MTHETLVCAEGVNPERLAALRHGALSTAEAARLRAHIAGCAACQARMAELEMALGALRVEPDLDPGERVIEGVRARIAGQRGGSRGGRVVWNMGGGRRVWAGLAALAPVAALILLFVYVFSGIARQPVSGPTPTASLATSTTGKPFYPTATPETVQVPTFTPAVSAATAWGGLTPVMSHTFAPNGSEEFVPQAYSSDLTTIGGVLFNISNSGTGAQAAQLAYYTVATGAITKLSPTWRGYGSPWGGMRSIDNRYIVYGFNTQPGGTCGVCNNTIWSLDRATGQTWPINRGFQGDMADYESADHVAFVGADNRVWVADLATQKVTLVLPNGAYPAATLGFQWPYLIYGELSSTTSPAITLNILDLATGVNTPIAEPLLDQSGNPISAPLMYLGLVGKTLYAVTYTQLDGVDARGRPVNVTYGALYRLDNAFSSQGKFITLANWPTTENGAAGYGLGSAFAASSRLIWLGSGYFWDETEGRLVTTSLTNVQLVGPYIVAVATDAQPQDSPVLTFHVTAYDTSGFPAPPGG